MGFALSPKVREIGGKSQHLTSIDLRHKIGPFHSYVFRTNKKAPNGVKESIGALSTVFFRETAVPVKSLSK
jgi:hypothetical protein